MAIEKNRRGRRQNWHTKVTAPPMALEFYEMLAKLQRSDAFATCHVYHGASQEGVPVIRWNTNVHRLPFVIASFMGLPSGSRRCDTPNCCNPFHYLPPADTGALFTQGRESDVLGENVAGLEEWMDLVEYEMDKRAKRIDQVTFEDVRGWIPAEDLSDDQLRTTLKYLKEKK